MDKEVLIPKIINKKEVLIMARMRFHNADGSVVTIGRDRKQEKLSDITAGWVKERAQMIEELRAAGCDVSALEAHTAESNAIMEEAISFFRSRGN